MREKMWYKSILILYVIVLFMFLAVAYFGNKAVTVFSENRGIGNRNTVIIDAGHGGVDGGAVSCTGVRESQINLQIALRLDDLMHLLGYRTKMIRTTDCSIHTKGDSIAEKKVSDLKERVRIINDTADGILVSVHQNYFSDSQYSGAQVFYADTEGSDELAAQMQAMMVKTLNPGSRRTSKKANGVYLLDHIERCGVLIECGFLSNPKEEALLRSDDYQKKLCCVIASAICAYLKDYCSVT